MSIHSNPLKQAEAVRLKLRDAGLAPIPVNGKIPLITGWQKLGGATVEDITSWTLSYPDHGNTGALTAHMPTCDIDILDQKAADACEQLVRNRFGDTGSLLVRIGLPPKRAVVFQTTKPFDKIAVSLVAPNGDAKQKIELLCKGQQVVVDGIHPDTHKPYTWFGGVLGDVKRGDLPHLNEAEAKMLVRDLAELLIVEHGYTLALRKPCTAGLRLRNGGGDGGGYRHLKAHQGQGPRGWFHGPRCPSARLGAPNGQGPDCGGPEPAVRPGLSGRPAVGHGAGGRPTPTPSTQRWSHEPPKIAKSGSHRT